MDKWLDIIVLAGKVIWVQILTVLHPIWELLEIGMNSFWFVFVLTILIGLTLLSMTNRMIFFYRAHNFIHRKMIHESTRDVEYSLFLRTVWQAERSKGLLVNAKTAKSRMLQFNDQERSFIQNYLEQRLTFLRNNQPLYIIGAIFIGLLSANFSGVISIEHVKWTGETTVKTTLFILVWLLIMQVKYVSLKKQTYHHLVWVQELNRTVPLEFMEDEAAIAIEKESNPSY